MIAPGVYNIKVQRRADYSVELQFRDSDQNPIDLTGWAAAASIWDVGRTTQYASFSVDYLSRPNGQIRLSLDYSDTEVLPLQSVYDVLLINPQGKREYYLEGTILTTEGYTTLP